MPPVYQPSAAMSQGHEHIRPSPAAAAAKAMSTAGCQLVPLETNPPYSEPIRSNKIVVPFCTRHSTQRDNFSFVTHPKLSPVYSGRGTRCVVYPSTGRTIPKTSGTGHGKRPQG